jgi:hypothetical protein
MYRTWAKSFNILGFRTAPRPLGYRAELQFRYRRQGLTFPTELRYDTFRAVGGGQTAPIRASTRSYSDYRITEIQTEQEIGETPSK